MAAATDAPARVDLIATLPQGALVATSLGIEGFGWHRSPGSAKFFHGRSIFLSVPHADGKPSFEVLEEGGWRQPSVDTAAALQASASGNRTKTALSNGALQIIPIDVPTVCHLMKTGGRALEMKGPFELARFANHACHERLTPDQVAAHVGRPPEQRRSPRCYMVLAPLEMLILSNLTPVEYAWYATHRPGKVFRSLAFAELTGPGQGLVAESVLADAANELSTHDKKTKTLVAGDLLNRIAFQDWVGYERPEDGGLYLADRNRILAWRFPSPVPSQWSRAEG